MKLKVFQSISQGFEIIIKNKIILAFSVLYAVITCLYVYINVYTPKIPTFNLNIFWFALVSIFLALVITKLSYDAINGNISISEAINLSLKKFIFVIIATIIYTIIGTIGLIFLVIPGIFLFNKFIFATYSILLNNEKIIDSFKKSWNIMKGNWWRVFGLHLLFLLPIVVLSVVSSLIHIGGATYTALAIDFIWALLSALLIITFTVAYVQLSKGEATREIEREEGKK